MNKILIVEDDMLNIEILKDIFGSNSKLYVAKNGKVALKILEKNIPDLILLDVVMPVMDGYETYRHIIENPKLKSIPVVFLSGISEIEKEILELDKSRFVTSIYKPFNVLTVKRLVFSILKNNNIKNSNSSKKKIVLLVDDEKDNIDILESMLKDEYDILYALSGKRAIEIAKKYEPDIILLDIMMPELDGFDVCKLLKYNPLTNHIPIIFVTAYDSTGNELKGFELGAVDYIAKPVVSAIVKARVKTHLSLVSQKNLLYQEVR